MLISGQIVLWIKAKADPKRGIALRMNLSYLLVLISNITFTSDRRIPYLSWLCAGIHFFVFILNLPLKDLQYFDGCQKLVTGQCCIH